MGDVEEVDLADEVFDVIISRAGISFFVNVVGTLRRLRSHLRPGGRLAAATWSSPDRVAFAAPVSTILRMLDLPGPPAGRPGPFALGDVERLAAVVGDAGSTDVETDRAVCVYEPGDPEETTQWLRDVAPPIVGMVESAQPELQQLMWQRVTESWRPFTTAHGQVRLPCEALLVTAINPG